MDKKVYLIKDVADLSGFSVHTIKYYLRCGLLKEVDRSPGTNFRYFDEGTLDRLRKIRDYRKNKMSINKITEILKEGK